MAPKPQEEQMVCLSLQRKQVIVLAWNSDKEHLTWKSFLTPEFHAFLSIQIECYHREKLLKKKGKLVVCINRNYLICMHNSVRRERKREYKSST